MKIDIEIDDQLLKSCLLRGRPSFFSIRWRLNGQAYPSDRWLDFGAVVLGWWLVSLSALLVEDAGGTANLSFMDGPYSLSLRLLPSFQVEVSAEGRPAYREIVGIDDLCTVITDAAERVRLELDKRGVGGKESIALKAGVEQVQTALRYSASRR